MPSCRTVLSLGGEFCFQREHIATDLVFENLGADRGGDFVVAEDGAYVFLGDAVADGEGVAGHVEGEVFLDEKCYALACRDFTIDWLLAPFSLAIIWKSGTRCSILRS